MIRTTRGFVAGLVLAATLVAGATRADETPTAPAPAAATPAAAAPAATAPTEPVLVSTDKISSGDTAWMLTSTALVLLMTIPGLALFYAGMVRKKNVLAMLMQSFAITCVVTILWWAIGYSWSFTPGTAWLGGTTRMFFNGTTLIYGFVVSYAILKLIDVTIGLRVSDDTEREGLDLALHGERIE